jgi:hypothetical protein
MSQQAGDRDASVTPTMQVAEDSRQGSDGLSAVPAAIVQHHDRSRVHMLHHPSVDLCRARPLPVVRIDAPLHRLQSQLARPAHQAPVDHTVGRAEQAGGETAGVADPPAGRGEVAMRGVGIVVHRVVADLAAGADDAAHHRLAAGDRLADVEEGGGGAEPAQGPEHLTGVRARPVIERQ